MKARSTFAKGYHLFFAAFLTFPLFVKAQLPTYEQDPFRQLEEVLPTPNDYRSASGAPGHEYWQQQADYDIEVTLDDENQSISGKEKVTYHNNSPLALNYLWFQLDQNRWKSHSFGEKARPAPRTLGTNTLSYKELKVEMALQDIDHGFDIQSVKSPDGTDIDHTIVDTMMRVDLPEPLKPGEKTELVIEWNHNLKDAVLYAHPAEFSGTRAGFEYFEEDGNYIYEVAQWYPRVAAYTDVNGWQHKQFLGGGEFTLEFGNIKAAITVPADHNVAATGDFLNHEEILSDTHKQRLAEAWESEKPIFITTPEEAKEALKSKSEETRTWIFEGKNVRDFAWASSRRFIWDAAAVQIGDNKVWAMSFYPPEAEPLWSTYSTHAIIHTLQVYSRLSFDYPYPKAMSINGPVNGMEYPMICFNGPRPQPDGTYTQQKRDSLISVIIHEVGHNFFPMIVNSDERQWGWMDEGLNSFLETVAEQEWHESYNSNYGNPILLAHVIRAAPYDFRIMESADDLLNLSYSAYMKPATALIILRETIMGRELFDFAFQEYSKRWAFKRPEPADFFRSMEDASGMDLDWFWRGWFYSDKKVDLSIAGVAQYEIDTKDPEIEKPKQKKAKEEEKARNITTKLNKGVTHYTDKFPELKDFYETYDEFAVTDQDKKAYEAFLATLSKEDKEILKSPKNIYLIQFGNPGGQVMPLILKITYKDGTSEVKRYPAQSFRYNSESASKFLLTDKEITTLELDPFRETADVNVDNNYWPSRPLRKPLQLTPEPPTPPNPMQLQKAAREAEKEQ